MVQIDLWQIAGFGGTLIAAFWAVAKVLAAQASSAIKDQFSGLSDELKAHGETSRRLERELMELKAELPRDYVRREDFTRVIATVEVKLDNLRLTIERYILTDRKVNP